MTTTQINWNWGTNTSINFNAATDTLDFGWFQADQFSEVNGTVVIAIPSNHQTYTLQHTTLHDLHLSNVIARDASAISEWTSVLGSSPVTPPDDTAAAGDATRAAAASGDTAAAGDATASSHHARRRCNAMVREQHLHHRNDRDGKWHHVQSQLVDARHRSS